MALYEGHPSAGLVADAIQRGEAILCSVNLGEVLYQLERSHGRRRAVGLVNKLRSVVAVEEADWDLVRLAAHVKVPGRLSYADSFCVATAIRRQARLYTGDPEIVGMGEIVDTVDLRRV